MSDWTDQLQPASWRGVPFQVIVEGGTYGRRFAVHVYPNRDTPWPEDMGRAPRRPVLAGYLIGDDALQQLKAMIAAAEAPGSGTLILPTQGAMTAVLVEPLKVTNRWDSQRVIELEFSFLEAGLQVYPDSAASTGNATTGAASNASTAASSDFSDLVGDL